MSKLLDDLSGHFRAIIDGLGEDPDREGLQDTPMRAAKAMQFLTRGYQQDLEEREATGSIPTRIVFQFLRKAIHSAHSPASQDIFFNSILLVGIDRDVISTFILRAVGLS